MMNILKDNPRMTQNMMSAMMETAKGDTSMMSGMIRLWWETSKWWIWGKIWQVITGWTACNGRNG